MKTQTACTYKQLTVLACLALLSPVFFSACMSSSAGEQLRGDLFEAKKRILDLERQLDQTGKKTDVQEESANKRIASTSVALDKINDEINKLAGQISVLRAGVKAGKLPDAPDDEESVAATIDSLNDRLLAVEKAQLDILKILEKSPKGAKETKDGDKSKSKAGSLTTVKAVKEAYGKKAWNQIATEAPGLIASAKKTKKTQEANDLTFYFSESLFRLGKLRDAALNYQELLNAKPKESQQIAIQKRLGDCFRLLGDKDTAKIFYHELIDKHPESNEAKEAQPLLKGLE